MNVKWLANEGMNVYSRSSGGRMAVIDAIFRSDRR